VMFSDILWLTTVLFWLIVYTVFVRVMEWQ
jgi:hypothetical protein